MKKRLLVLGLTAMLVTSCTDAPSVDHRAEAFVGRLGPLCQNFDFQTKEEVGDGEMRPVFCSEADDDRDHPHFILYVFSDEATAAEWRQMPVMEGTGQVHGDTWSATSDDDILEEVQRRLGG